MPETTESMTTKPKIRGCVTNSVEILGCKPKYKDEIFIWSVFSFAFSQFHQFLLWFNVFVFSDISDKVTAALLHRLPKSITKMLLKSFVFERNSVK